MSECGERGGKRKKRTAHSGDIRWIIYPIRLASSSRAYLREPPPSLEQVILHYVCEMAIMTGLYVDKSPKIAPLGSSHVVEADCPSLLVYSLSVECGDAQWERSVAWRMQLHGDIESPMQRGTNPWVWPNPGLDLRRLHGK